MKIGIDIGGSHIAIALVNEEGKIVEKIENDLNIKQSNMADYIVNYVDKGIEKLIKFVDIQEIGIAAPGNPKGTTLTNLVNLKIDKVDFKILEEKYNVKIKSINDAKAAALAENEYGNMKKYNDSVFLCLGTGIGGAVFLQNKLLQPIKNPGFELGHMIIERQGKPCNCGKKGCFETYCSMKRFKDEIKSTLKLILMDEEKFDDEQLNSIEIKELLEQNIENKEVQAVINEYIKNLKIGLSNIIDIFEPEVICLGGSFVHFKGILYDKLIKEMETNKYVFNKNSDTKIVLAKLGNDAGIIGATLI